MTDPDGFDPGEGSSSDFFRRPIVIPDRAPSTSPSPPPRPRILKRRSPPRDPEGFLNRFAPFPFRSDDVSGYPYTPDFHKAVADKTLPSSEASCLLPEPHATASREFPESHPGIENHPTFQSPAPFEWRLGEDIQEWSADRRPRQPNLDGEHSRQIHEVLDKGVLNESSNFVPARLPGYKGVRKWGQYSRDPGMERPALLNMIPELPGDSLERKQLNSGVLDVMNCATCTGLLVEQRLRGPAIDPNDHDKIKCCRLEKQRENTRSCWAKLGLGAGVQKTRYHCGSRKPDTRQQFRSRTNVAKKTKKGESIMYAYALTIVRPVETGYHMEETRRLIDQRRQTAPLSLINDFNPKHHHIEIGLFRPHSSDQRSDHLGLKRKYYGRKGDRATVDSGTDDEQGEDIHFRRNRHRKTRLLANVLRDRFGSDSDDDDDDGDQFYNETNREGSNPSLIGPPLPNISQAHRMAGFAKLLYDNDKMGHRDPSIPLSRPVSLSHPLMVWRHSVHDRNATNIAFRPDQPLPRDASTLDQYFADSRNREPYSTFVSQLPSMAVQRKVLELDGNVAMNTWCSEFEPNQRERTQVVIDDHRNLRRNRTLNTPHSLNRGISLW